MRRIVLTWGLAAGAVLGVMMLISVPLMKSGRLDRAEVFGYTSMVLAFLLVFFGIRRYRDEVAGGVIGFGRAVAVGLAITAVASLVYVASWQVIQRAFFPDFVASYSAHQLEKLRAEGADAAKLREAEAQMAEFARLYANPLFNAGMTFLEPLPVGVVMTLVSAGILRRRPSAGERMPASA